MIQMLVVSDQPRPGFLTRSRRNSHVPTRRDFVQEFWIVSVGIGENAVRGCYCQPDSELLSFPLGAAAKLWVLRGRKLAHTTPRTVGVAGGLHRFNRVVVSRARPQVLHQHAECHIGMIPVPAVGRLCYLPQVLAARAVVRNSVMKLRTTRTLCGPSDYRR